MSRFVRDLTEFGKNKFWSLFVARNIGMFKRTLFLRQLYMGHTLGIIKIRFENPTRTFHLSNLTYIKFSTFFVDFTVDLSFFLRYRDRPVTVPLRFSLIVLSRYHTVPDRYLDRDRYSKRS
jgi:hypothetical protein